MTAEIVVMNRYGVSMAADSAITLGPRLEYYNNHNKLFALSKCAPVGVMFYEVADFCGVPWETILKEYKARPGTKTFPHLKDYLDDLISFVVGISKNFSEEIKNNFNLQDTFLFLEQNLEEEDKQNREKFDLKIQKIKGYLSKYLDSTIIYENIEKQFNLSRNQLSHFLVETFPHFLFDDKSLENVFDVIKLYWVKDIYRLGTGIVVSGYGESDLFPSCASCMIGQFVGDQLKHSESKLISIDAIRMRAEIVPFGQTDIALAYLRGVHDSVEAFSQQKVLEMVHTLVVCAADLLGGSTDEDKKKAVEIFAPVAIQLHGKYQEQMKDFLDNDYIFPILQSIQNLSKDELAVVAESLVKMTSLKKKISIGDKTVGGAIDVAVITKGDGLVWIERKHYFDGNKNPHFLAKYYQLGGHNE